MIFWIKSPYPNYPKGYIVWYRERRKRSAFEVEYPKDYNPKPKVRSFDEEGRLWNSINQIPSYKITIYTMMKVIWGFWGQAKELVYHSSKLL